MWPQKWYASASPGATSEPTVFAPATPITATPTRARKPRRELASATESAIRPPWLTEPPPECPRPAAGPAAAGVRARSRADRSAPPLRRREHGLELGTGVEGALGQDG